MSNLFPSRKQWKSWSLPSKATYIGMCLGVVAIVIAVFFGIFTLLPPKEPLATKKDIKDLSQLLFKEKPQNPSLEEVDSEIDKEIKAAFKNQKQKGFNLNNIYPW